MLDALRGGSERFGMRKDMIKLWYLWCMSYRLPLTLPVPACFRILGYEIDQAAGLDWFWIIDWLGRIRS